MLLVFCIIVLNCKRDSNAALVLGAKLVRSCCCSLDQECPPQAYVFKAWPLSDAKVELLGDGA